MVLPLANYCGWPLGPVRIGDSAPTLCALADSYACNSAGKRRSPLASAANAMRFSDYCGTLACISKPKPNNLKTYYCRNIGNVKCINVTAWGNAKACTS